MQETPSSGKVLWERIYEREGIWGISGKDRHGQEVCKILFSGTYNPHAYWGQMKPIVEQAISFAETRPGEPPTIDQQHMNRRFVHRLSEEVRMITGVPIAIKGFPISEAKHRENLVEQFIFMHQLRCAWQEKASPEDAAILKVCPVFMSARYTLNGRTQQILLMQEIRDAQHIREIKREYDTDGYPASPFKGRFGVYLNEPLTRFAPDGKFDTFSTYIQKVTGLYPHDLRGYNLLLDSHGLYWIIDVHANSQVARAGI
jgi:hypothetical protein